LGLVTIFLIALALSMDAFAVSITNGMIIKKFVPTIAFKISFSFGFFQAIMPLIGWGMTYNFRKYIEAFGHWIAFGLLFIIGLKMIFEAIYHKDETKKINICSNHYILLLAIATSIDALIAGIGFALIPVPIILIISIIGITTFLVSLIGIIIGLKYGNIFGNKVEILGGIILIIIGAKILFQHLQILN
jgi:putative Mn2+ efflux pump MntP